MLCLSEKNKEGIPVRKDCKRSLHRFPRGPPPSREKSSPSSIGAAPVAPPILSGFRAGNMREQVFLPNVRAVAFPEAAVANLIAQSSCAAHGAWWVRGVVHWVARARRTRGRRKRRNCGKGDGCQELSDLSEEREDIAEENEGGRQGPLFRKEEDTTDEESGDGNDGENGLMQTAVHCVNEFAILPRTCGWGTFGKVKAVFDMAHQLRPLAFKASCLRLPSSSSDCCVFFSACFSDQTALRQMKLRPRRRSEATFFSLVMQLL